MWIACWCLGVPLPVPRADQALCLGRRTGIRGHRGLASSLGSVGWSAYSLRPSPLDQLSTSGPFLTRWPSRENNLPRAHYSTLVERYKDIYYYRYLLFDSLRL